MGRCAGLRAGFEALIVVAKLEIDHATHGVGPIDRRSAHRHHFDLFERSRRYETGIYEIAVALGGDAVAV